MIDIEPLSTHFNPVDPTVSIAVWALLGSSKYRVVPHTSVSDDVGFEEISLQDIKLPVTCSNTLSSRIPRLIITLAQDPNIFVGGIWLSWFKVLEAALHFMKSPIELTCCSNLMS